MNGNKVMANYKVIKAMLNDPENDLSIIIGIMASECGARLHKETEQEDLRAKFLNHFEQALESGLGA